MRSEEVFLGKECGFARDPDGTGVSGGARGDAGRMLGGSAGKEKGAVGKRIQRTFLDKAPEYPHPLAIPRLGDGKLGSDPAAAVSIS